MKKHAFYQQASKYVRCWKIILKDSRVFRFTEHDQDILMRGERYLGCGITDVNLIEKHVDKKSFSEISGVINKSFLSEKDILVGVLDDAELLIYYVDFVNSEQLSYLFKKQYINSVRCENGVFYANLSDLSHKLDAHVLESFSPKCRAMFCDEKCGLLSNDFTKEGIVKKVFNAFSFYDGERKEENHYYVNGTIEIFSNNQRDKFLVERFEDGVVTFVPSLFFELREGDVYKIIAGCDKRLRTCCDKFDNAINFRGEPFISEI